jgi:endoglucanase
MRKPPPSFVCGLAAALSVAALLAAPRASAQLPPAQPRLQPPAQVDPRGADPRSPNPLAGETFFVDRRGHPAWRQYRWYRRGRKRWAASMIWRVAREPKFQWFGRWSRPAGRAIREHLRRARREQPGSVPLVTVLRHQGKKCGGGYGGGGPREDARTRRWYRSFARGIGRRRVVIAFEPDSLGTIDCLRPNRRFARMRLLRYGVKVLSKLPNATIYLEGGAADWESARRTAWQLRYIGIRRVRGFMLNVTHYEWTRASIRHGLAISRRTGGKPFIISTSFNGRGPVHYWRRVGRKRRRINVWCHPLKRGLGTPPTTETSHPRVDAYMWIGRPGYSGGSCNGGPLPVGSWWPRRALMFARWATEWEGPPRRTRNGHRRHFSLRQLGG